jgi:hypothetical protein
MKKSIIFILILFSQIQTKLNAQLNKNNLELGYDKRTSKFEETKTKQFNKLKLYYITAKPSLQKETKEIGNYLNLETALKQGKIIITEISKAGSVNSLLFKNISKEVIMVQMGDVVQGGKQDRVIENDALIKPGEKVELSVYCVEHGRWRDGQDRNANSSASFSTYHGSINSELKKTIVKEKNQSRVWDKVAELNTLNSTQTSTGTYTAMTSSTTYNNDVQKYMTSFLAEIEAQKNIVGVLAVTGDKIIGCEIYSSPALFKSNAKNILNSFISEAIINGSTVNIDDEKVNKYLTELLESEEKQDAILQNNGKSLKLNGKKVKLSSF